MKPDYIHEVLNSTYTIERLC